MTETERRSGTGNRSGAKISTGLGSDHEQPTVLDPADDPELLAAVHACAHRMVRAAHRVHGRIPTLGPEFVAAPWLAQVAALAVLGEHWVLRSPDEIAADQLKDAAIAISTGADWAAASRRPSHAELVARRAEVGPMARPFDPVAARRWVKAGDSREGAA